MSKPKFNKFKVPKKTLDQLYEVTGGTNNYKGFIIAYATENGEPIVYTKCDTQMTEYALHKALESFLARSEEESFEIEE